MIISIIFRLQNMILYKVQLSVYKLKQRNYIIDVCMGRQRASFCEKRRKRILDSDRKLKVFSRKEMRSGRESSKARKESQGNAIFPVETDGWMIGRRTNERGSGGTDRRASKHTGEQADEQSRPIEAAAGRLHSNELATLRRTPEDLYPRLARCGAAWHGTVRSDSVRFDSALGCTRHQPRDSTIR